MFFLVFSSFQVHTCSIRHTQSAKKKMQNGVVIPVPHAVTASVRRSLTLELGHSHNQCALVSDGDGENITLNIQKRTLHLKQGLETTIYNKITVFE